MYSSKTDLISGKPGLMRWIIGGNTPQMQDLSTYWSAVHKTSTMLRLPPPKPTEPPHPLLPMDHLTHFTFHSFFFLCFFPTDPAFRVWVDWHWPCSGRWCGSRSFVAPPRLRLWASRHHHRGCRFTRSQGSEVWSVGVPTVYLFLEGVIYNWYKTIFA